MNAVDQPASLTAPGAASAFVATSIFDSLNSYAGNAFLVSSPACPASQTPVFGSRRKLAGRLAGDGIERREFPADCGQGTVGLGRATRVAVRIDALSENPHVGGSIPSLAICANRCSDNLLTVTVGVEYGRGAVRDASPERMILTRDGTSGELEMTDWSNIREASRTADGWTDRGALEWPLS